MLRFTSVVVALVLGSGVAAQRGAAPAERVERSGGYSVVSPSVVATSATKRDASGVVSVDILILWRGSPGWMYRRSGSGSSSTGGSPDRAGSIEFSEYQGGLHLTATYVIGAPTVTVLGEHVELKGANVVLVDGVDSPDGPVVVKTLTVPPTRRDTIQIATVLRHTPELLDYLRCEAQIPGGLNHPSMMVLCTEAILTAAVKAPVTSNAIPTGPVTNRAAGTAPPRPERTLPPGTVSSGDGALSAAVAGGWFTHAEAGGAVSLDLLVLWRGSPGWLLQDSHGGSSGGGTSATSRRGMNVHYGERSLYAAYGVGPRRYTVENDTKPLGDDNVVLVDDVDSASGPRVIKTLHVDPAVPDGRRIDQLIARSPELVAYLRCDAKIPDARKQAMVDILCARYSGK